MRTLTLGYSPCPNDTFIFYALVHGKIHTGGIRFKETLLDVETLNGMALRGELDVTKVSAHAYLYIKDRYRLLRSGGAMGRGCGPLVVSKVHRTLDELRGKKIAIPGSHTTAFLLLRLYDPELGENAVAMPFNEIMGAVRDGSVDAGLIIHEGRFTYPDYGLTSLIDLGQWWEGETGLPIPLGFIVAKNGLDSGNIERLIKESVLYSMANRDEPMEYIKAHAQEMEDSVIGRHIGLYVNDYTVDMGDEGMRAVDALFDIAARRGII